MKKLLCVFIILLLVATSSFSAYATSADDVFEPLSGGSNYLNLKEYKQPYGSDQCGPTCCQVVLDHFGIFKNLPQICNEMSNMPDGDYTHIDAVTQMLNTYIAGRPYIKKSLDGNAYANFRSSIDSNYPVVCHLKTGALPAYNGVNYNHYVVANGYSWAQGGAAGGYTRINYYDPHYLDRYQGFHECDFIKLQTAISNYYGLYVMGR